MALPSVSRRLVVQKLTADFRAAVKIVEEPVKPPGEREMLIKNASVGINASDVNFTAGSYLPGIKPPFNCGFEAVGTVVAAGAKAMLKPGDHCLYSDYGAFSEYHTVRSAFPLDRPDPHAIPLLVSGLTAAISLEINGVDIFRDTDVKPQRTGLVTAAAGGTGQFAIQLMKNAGIENVIGTCSTEEKAKFLESIGATHVINTSTKKLGVELPELCPRGINIAYESVGGKLLDSTISNLAVAGKCISIGFISNYQAEGGLTQTVSPGAGIIPIKLLQKSASLCGFFLMDYPHLWAPTFSKLIKMVSDGSLTSTVDNGPGAGFNGLESIPDAVDYLFSKKSIGKIIVNL